MRTLHLALKKQAFDVMVTGEKKVEYRKKTKWLLSRLIDKDKKEKFITCVKFTRGYGTDKPYFVAIHMGWGFAQFPISVDFSNGLQVEVETGDIVIRLGNIIEKGNI